MNIRLPFSDLESALTQRLRELLGSVEWLKGLRVEEVKRRGATDAGFDLLATFSLPPGGKAALCVECRSELRPSTFRMIADRTFSPAGRPKVVVPVLALPWVSPRVSELCREHGWSWFDLAGNCRLDVPGVLRLHHTGNPPVHERPRPTANLSTPEAGRVIRALLHPYPPHAALRWTQRRLQFQCHPLSLGLINKVVTHLREEAYIEALAGGGVRLVDPVRLLFAWRDAYRFDRHERRGYFTLLQGGKLNQALGKLEEQTKGLAAFAAFSAAEFQAPHVRQPKIWLYVEARQLPAFEEMVQAKRVDSGENISVLVPNDLGVLYYPGGYNEQKHPLPCTIPVQTYVDLWHCGGRGREAAEALLEQSLKPAWRATGLKA